MKGWECPKCGACYAPFVTECARCKPDTAVAFTLNTGGIVKRSGERADFFAELSAADTKRGEPSKYGLKPSVREP
jgi:hypothetical protein